MAGSRRCFPSLCVRRSELQNDAMRVLRPTAQSGKIRKQGDQGGSTGASGAALDSRFPGGHDGVAVEAGTAEEQFEDE